MKKNIKNNLLKTIIVTTSIDSTAACSKITTKIKCLKNQLILNQTFMKGLHNIDLESVQNKLNCTNSSLNKNSIKTPVNTTSYLDSFLKINSFNSNNCKIKCIINPLKELLEKNQNTKLFLEKYIKKP